MKGQNHELLAVGLEVDFNDLGKAAHVNLPVPCGRSAWIVVRIIDVQSPPAPHPQLVDLGAGYSIGPVSAMFLTVRKGTVP